MKLAPGAAAFVCGAGVGYFLITGASPGAAVLLLAAVVFAAVALGELAPPPRTMRLRLLLVAAALIGVARGSTAVPTAPVLPDEVRSADRATIRATLVRDPRPYGDAYVLPVRAGAFRAGDDWIDAAFRVDVIASQLSGASAAGRTPDGFLVGDRYEITGDLIDAAFSTAAARDAAAVVRNSEVRLLDGDAGGLSRALASLRGALGRAIDRSSPHPVSGLVKALVTGSRAGLTAETRESFRRSGTSHVLAISGLHMGIVASATLAGSAWLLGRRRQLYLLVPTATVWLYAALAGFTSPVARAAIMVSVYLGGRALGRQRSVATALSVAAAVMIGLDPSALGGVSFQLSFLAVLGIATVTPTLTRVCDDVLGRFEDRVNRVVYAACRGLASGVAVSIGALSFTMPVIALTFDAVSAWGIPATLLQVPALPFLIVSGGLEAVLGLAWAPLGVIPAVPAWLLGQYVIGVAGVFARLPGGAIQPGLALGVAGVAYYGLLIALLNRRRIRLLVERARGAASPDAEATAGTAYLGGALGPAGAASSGGMPAPVQPPIVVRRSLIPRKRAPRWLLLAVLATAVVTWAAALSLPDGRLTVTCFETEGGDALLIRTPSGRQVLIDGGQAPLGAVRALGSRLPFWDRSLDIVMLTHPHADHVTGLLAVLDRYRVDAILDSSTTYDSEVYQEWLVAADVEGARRVQAVADTTVVLDRGVVLQVLMAQPEEIAPDPNDRSIVVRLAYGKSSFLFTGDLTSISEHRLVAAGADVHADVLKVGHQGSRGSSSEEFLGAVSPSIALVPASIGNQYGHPHAEAMERVLHYVDEDRLLITKERGTIDVSTDGSTYRVKTVR